RGLPGFVESHQPGMLELGGAASLADKTIDLFTARQSPGPKQFDGHDSTQLGVACAEDLAEGAKPQLLKQLEFPKATRRIVRRVTEGGAGNSQQLTRNNVAGRRLLVGDLSQAREKRVGMRVERVQGRLASGA